MSIDPSINSAFDDPASVLGYQEEQLAKFREVRDQIEAKITSWLKTRA
ncbi:MAG: hypothetical protein NWE95_08815 [Candidatus Bathyarchaeota archaeon]|nr:hypothetical protein [Candidatus Bathyarchaeota archaeon]